LNGTALCRRRDESLKRIFRQRTSMVASIKIDVEAFQAAERALGDPAVPLQPTAKRLGRFQVKIAGLDGESLPFLALPGQPFGDLRSADLRQPLEVAAFQQAADAVRRLLNIVGRIVLGRQEPLKLVDMFRQRTALVNLVLIKQSRLSPGRLLNQLVEHRLSRGLVGGKRDAADESLLVGVLAIPFAALLALGASLGRVFADLAPRGVDVSSNVNLEDAGHRRCLSGCGFK